MATLFVSHSSRDAAWATRLHEALQAAGYECLFLDFHPDDGIHAGADWEQTLYQRLRQCRGVVALCTADWLQSPWCVAEALIARERGKGTHAAVDRLQAFAQRHRYVLRADIVQHFPAIDHAVLLEILRQRIPEPDVMALVEAFVASGRGALEDEYRYVRFDGDDLLAPLRPRGLPIGNLTSQFWSNCYLHPFDQFVTRELGCSAYLRYVDDFALFSDSKSELWAWKRAIVSRLARLRLVIHAAETQVQPVERGIPWLGFVVFPTHRRVKARKVRSTHRHLRAQVADYHAGHIGLAELDASITGWIAHVRHADSWGLRGHVLETLAVRPAERIRALASRAASRTDET